MTLVDEKDLLVIAELQRNAKATTGQITKRTGIPVTTVHNRMKSLEKTGVIKRYVPILDYVKLGKGLHALIFITVEGKGTDQEVLAKAMLKITGVEKASILTGGYDLLLDAHVADVDALNTLLIKELRQLPGVDKTQTMLVLKEEE
ncbi:Lrp/AsnC family transcriptional regulator [Candidatus Woesearchaeota archaeon]|nr:Lrp/AsnC family transcriptional regulator [Candidatus Woesearchaeota archaeon]